MHSFAGYEPRCISIPEAAEHISRVTGADVSEIQSAMLAAARDGKLTLVYRGCHVGAGELADAAICAVSGSILLFTPGHEVQTFDGVEVLRDSLYALWPEPKRSRRGAGRPVPVARLVRFLNTLPKTTEGEHRTLAEAKFGSILRRTWRAAYGQMDANKKHSIGERRSPSRAVKSAG